MIEREDPRYVFDLQPLNILRGFAPVRVISPVLDFVVNCVTSEGQMSQNRVEVLTPDERPSAQLRLIFALCYCI